MNAQLSYAVITGLLSVLVLLIRWIGSNTLTKIDHLTESINSLGNDLHGQLNEHDKRITLAEMRIENIKNKV